MNFINIGFKGTANADKIISILPIYDKVTDVLIDNAKKTNKFIDATSGHKGVCILIMDDNYVILLGISSDTIYNRLANSNEGNA